jgi:hypothetical protein
MVRWRDYKIFVKTFYCGKLAIEMLSFAIAVTKDIFKDIFIIRGLILPLSHVHVQIDLTNLLALILIKIPCKFNNLSGN